MEATKRERIVLYGIVPIVAACLGAIVTVVAQRMFGATAPDEVMLAVIQLEGVTAAERMKLLEVVNENSEKLYNFLNTAAVLLLVPFAGVIWAYSSRIRG